MFITPAYAQAAGAAPGMNDLMGMMLPLVAIMAVFYFLMIRPQQRKMKDHQELLKKISRGDTVVTNGGLIGKVTKVIDDNEVEIDLGGTKVTALRSTLSDVRVKGEPVANQNAKK